MEFEERSKVGGKQFRVGRVLQIVLALLLSVGAMNNVLKTPEALRNAALLGYQEVTLLPLAGVLLLSSLLYIVPRTALLGALMLTGWLGGAVATHVIHGDGLLVLSMPVIFGGLVWLQDSFVRRHLPIQG